METLQQRPEPSFPRNTPHTPPYTPYAPSKRRFERADSPASIKSIQPLETISPAKKAPEQAVTDDVKVQELLEGDAGYITDTDVVYPEELEEAESDAEDEPGSSASDDDITHTLSRLDCQDDEEVDFRKKWAEKRIRKRKEARVFKRTHSQAVKDDTHSADSSAMANRDLNSGVRRLRRRVRGPSGDPQAFERITARSQASGYLAPAAEIREQSHSPLGKRSDVERQSRNDPMDIDESE